MLIVKEHSSEKYSPRTYYNAKSADLTVALACDLTTAGEKLTKKAAGNRYIGFDLTKEDDHVVIAREIYREIMRRNQCKSGWVQTLNIAGNGIYTLSKFGYDQQQINRLVYKTLHLLHQHHPINKIYTGGQTGVDLAGVDLAGAVAGYALNIETEVTLPKGFIQRYSDGIDVRSSEEFIRKSIMDYTSEL